MVAAPMSAQAEVTVETRGAGAALFSRRDKEVLLSGPAGTGKTVSALWKLHLAALKYPGMRALMVRKVGTALAASALVSFQQHVLGSGNFGVKFFGGSKIKPGQFEYPNGSVIVVGGLDNPDKIMSSEYDICYVNEATELDEADWESITSRLRFGRMPYQQLFGDCNPSYPSHWLKRRCDAGKTLELPSKHEDNPRYHDGVTWTADGLDYLDTLDKLSGHRYQRLRLGKWVAAEGLVYPNFRPEQIQVVDCSGWATALGLDLGTRNPTCILTVRYAGDRIHFESEFYRTGLGSDEIEAEAERRYHETNADWIVVDPSAAGLITTLTNRGLNVRKAVNDIVVGISRFTAALPSITVDPSCVNMLAEFESYAYSTTQRTARDVPVKANDHCLIAGTLVRTEFSSKPIEYVTVGERVWTRYGLRRVSAAGMTNPSVQVYTVTLSDGRTITGSSKHPFWANNQWKYLDELRYGDILSAWTNELTLSSSMALPSIATPMQKGGLSDPITSRIRVIGGAVLDAFTKRFGKRTMAQSLRAITFTITTKIRSTMTPEISGAYSLPNISLFTGVNPQANASVPTSTTFDTLRLSGIAQKRGERGIAHTRIRHGANASPLNVSAFNVEPRSSPSPCESLTVTVRTTASQHIDGQAELTTWTVPVPTAEPFFGPIGTVAPVLAPVSVVGVHAEPVRQAVYNLTVEDIPEFFANGILVHNSMDTGRYIIMELETPEASSWDDLSKDDIKAWARLAVRR